MEALEVVRRWMWVYLRLEWEAVRKGAGGVLETREGETRPRDSNEEDVIGRARLGASGNGLMEEYKSVDKSKGDVGSEEEIGLGILVLNDREAKL